MSEKDVFATLPAGRRIWAVAAIHGEAGRLCALHAGLRERVAVGDTLVYLGNLMGHGAAVFETIDEILLFRRALLARPGADCADFVYLRGSQEEMWHRLLQAQFAINPKEVLTWMFDHGVEATVRAYGSTARDGLQAASRGARALTEWTSRLRAAMRAADGHNALMSSLRRAALTEDRALLLVNAGIDASRPLSEQFDSFWWAGAAFESLKEPIGEFRRIVRGFDPRHKGINIRDFAVSVDGGCGFGGPLTATCFDSRGEIVESLDA